MRLDNGMNVDTGVQHGVGDLRGDSGCLQLLEILELLEIS